MKKLINSVLVILIVTHVTLSAAEEVQVNRLSQFKSFVSHEFNELKKCMKRNQNCDRFRRNLYLAVGTLLLLVPVSWHVFSKKKAAELRKAAEKTLPLPEQKTVVTIQEQMRKNEWEIEQNRYKYLEGEIYKERLKKLQNLTEIYRDKSMQLEKLLPELTRARQEEVYTKRKSAIALIQQVISMRNQGVGNPEQFAQAKHFLESAINIVDGILNEKKE